MIVTKLNGEKYGERILFSKGATGSLWLWQK
jgi:hypothetical protein